MPVLYFETPNALHAHYRVSIYAMNIMTLMYLISFQREIIGRPFPAFKMSCWLMIIHPYYHLQSYISKIEDEYSKMKARAKISLQYAQLCSFSVILWKAILLVRKKFVNIEPLLRNASRRSISQKAKPFVEGNFTCLAFGDIKKHKSRSTN